MPAWDDEGEAGPAVACPGLDPGPFQTKVEVWNGPGSSARLRASSPRLCPGQVKSEEIHCICIDPRFVDRVWPLVAHLVRAAMVKGRISEFADVERVVLDGRALLWIAADTRAIWAAAVTQIGYLAGQKLCTIVACGGRERSGWLEVKSAIEAYARAEGCAAIRIFGRRGWVKALPDYRVTRVLLEKSL